MWSWLLGVPLGVVAQLQQESLWHLGFYGLSLLCAVGCVAVWRGTRRSSALGLQAASGLLATALLAFAVTGIRAQIASGKMLAPELEGVVLTVTGQVVGLPRAGETGWQLVLEVERATLEDKQVAVPDRIRLSWHGLQQQIRTGQLWRLPVVLKRPHGLANPQGFDAELWLWEDGVGATGNVSGRRSVDPPLLLDTTSWDVMAAWRQSVRDSILASGMDARAGGVLAALVTGDQGAISQRDWEVFRATGVAHLVSVSGTHVTMFAWLAAWCLGGLWRLLAWRWPDGMLKFPAPWVSGIGGFALALGYAVFSGWGVPAQRTVWMLGVAMGLRLSGRRWPWPATWLAVMSTVLLWDPWAFLQPGFWLSFVAVGVLFATSRAPMECARGRWAAVWGLLRTQGVVTVALAPLTLLLFGQFSLVGLLANLPAIPFVTLVITPLAMAGVLWAPAWQLGAGLLKGAQWWLEWLASWPAAVIERPVVPLGMALLAVSGGLLLVMRLPWSWRAWGVLLVWPALLAQPSRPPIGEFEVVALDVGQGTAVVVRTAHHTLLFDTGPPWGREGSVAERAVLPVLRAGGDRLDAVVVSHPDSDHAAGSAAVALAHPQAQWWSSLPGGVPEPTPWQRCEMGDSWTWDGVPFVFVHPSRVDYQRGGSDNGMSCVLLVGQGEASVLLTGDIELEQEARLIRAWADLRVGLLVVPHHGSKTSSGAEFLDQLRPRVAVMQYGYRNRYGHPAPLVVSRYEERGIPWVGSPECGTATWRSDDPAKVSCYRHQYRRYWHHKGAVPNDGS